MSELQSGTSTKTIAIAVVVVLLVSATAAAVYLTGGFAPTTTTTTTPPGTKSLDVLTRHDISIMNIFEPAFLASDFAIDNNITDIKWRTPNQENWDNVIIAGDTDVCWGGGPTLFDQLMRDDLLYPLTSDRMTEVASRVNSTIAGAAMKRNNTDDQLVWIAAAISSFGFTVNHAFLYQYGLPVPSTWTDLANITYGSLLPTATISMGNAPLTTSNTRIYEIITQTFGWEEGWTIMARMAGNAAIYPGSVETQDAVEDGAVGIAMSIDFYGYLSQFVNPDCEYIVPEGQTIVNGDPIAIASTSPQKDLAEGFVDFVLSPEGQALWLNNNIRRMPVMREAFDHADPETTADLYLSFNNTLKTIGIDFNDTLSLEINTALVTYWGCALGNAHTELVNCWSVILQAFDDGIIDATGLDYYAGLMGALLSVQDFLSSETESFTIDYAREINNNLLNNPEYANEMEQRWTAAAQVQYVNVMNTVLDLYP